ncbi:hypothetical protein [Cryobacterium sp. 10I5]|uniref:hypothetical protein n=1 Tax=Cryobacterium sp. 10I5 TaxID=3048581 RepID=UPI002B238DEE|nr:hypothetical protein [Cryobacterium sp. 10I5]MEB0265470.1 hypothetical protein [Cryobacterium sp. 10I5]
MSTLLGFNSMPAAASMAISISTGSTIALLFVASFLHFVEGQKLTRTIWLVLGCIALSGVIPLIRSYGVEDASKSSWLAAHACLFGFCLLWRAFTIDSFYRCLGITMILSLASIALGQSAFSIDARNVFVEGRLTGVFGHPNLSGMAAALTIVLAAHRRKVVSVVGISAIVVVVGSLSLTSLVSLALGLIVVWTRPVRAVKLVILALVTASYFAPLVLASLSSSEADLHLFTGRVAVWEWVLSQHFDPTIGGGLSAFTSLSRLGQIPWVHAHNQLLMDVATGGGTLAALTVIWIIVLGRSAVNAESVLPLAVWAMLIIHSITEVPFFVDYPGGRLLLLTLSIGAIISSQARSAVPSRYRDETPLGGARTEHSR